MKTITKSDQKVQTWGNSLALRLSKDIARSVGLTAGQPVNIAVQDRKLVITPVGTPKLTLEQKLKLFDPAVHGGEVMATGLVGLEKL